MSISAAGLPVSSSEFAKSRISLAGSRGLPDEYNTIAFWPNLMFKAYAKFADVVPPFKFDNNPGYVGTVGGAADLAQQALTGKKLRVGAGQK